jgi:fructose-1,6-bisphosphatase I
VAAKSGLSKDTHEVISRALADRISTPFTHRDLMTKKVSLTRYLIEQQRQDGHIPELRLLLKWWHGLAASARPSRRARSAAPWQRRQRKRAQAKSRKLDIIANEVLIEANEWGTTAMASEEMDSIYLVPNRYPQGEYLLLFDPPRRLQQHRRERQHRHHLQRAEESRGHAGVQESDFLQAASRWPPVTACTARNHAGAHIGDGVHVHPGPRTRLPLC